MKTPVSNAEQQQQHPHPQQQQHVPTRGAIVVVAKCPIPGKSKTRLIPLLGHEGSTQLAKAMLSDVLLTLDKCPAFDSILKILLYAPANKQGLEIMQGILQELDLVEEEEEEGGEVLKPHHVVVEESSFTSTTPTTTTTTTKNNNNNTSLEHLHRKVGWTLLPMLSRDLQATDLGTILQDALERARSLQAAYYKVDDNNNHDNNNNNIGSVVFLGMDAPELPLPDIVAGLTSSANTCIMCPADDGGYGMLSVPSQAISQNVFTGVLWSHPLTAVSQLKALTDSNNQCYHHHHHHDATTTITTSSSVQGVPRSSTPSSSPPFVLLSVIMGQLMHDIDEPENVQSLCQRLLQNTTNNLIGSTSLEEAEEEEVEMNENDKSELHILDQPSTMGRIISQQLNHNAICSHHPICYYTRQTLIDLEHLGGREEKIG